MKVIRYSSHSSGGQSPTIPLLTRPVGGMAERIEAVEAVGWRMDQFTAVPYKDNITVVALFRRHHDRLT